MSKGTLVFLSTLGAAVVHAQSMNVDFNFAGVSTAPSAGYAAAGLSGVWNTANMTGNTVPTLSLVDLSGSSTAATLNVPVILGNWSNLGSWTGDDMLLMDDSGGSVGQTVNFSGLLNGSYDVFVYGMSATGNVNSSFYIGSATQNNTGGWTGSHVLGASYGLFSAVAVTNGTIQIGWVGNFNGVQLVYTPVPEPATIAGLALGALAVLRKRQKRA